MGTIKKFEDLVIWQLARQLCIDIWEEANKGTFPKDGALKRQITSASGSIMDNIAEGFGRGGNKEFINFLGIARASNDEVRSQLYRALDRKHISNEIFEKLIKDSMTLGTKVNNFIEYLRKSDMRGQKFK
jgi:four helix bundle protein